MEKIDETIYTENYLGKIGELALKGGNIKLFERQLVNNLKEALRGQKAIVQIMTGRLYVYSARECTAQVEYALDHLIGITGWAKARAVEKDIESIRKAVREEGLIAKENGARTFKIVAKREDKNFPLNSFEIATQTAGVLYDDKTLDVDVHKPDAVINIEVRKKCYVYRHQKKTLPWTSSWCQRKGTFAFVWWN